MNDLIRREDVIKLIQARYENPEICAEEINRIPTIDAVPVVRCGERALLDRAPCPARDSETGETRNCIKYCGCGVRKG